MYYIIDTNVPIAANGKSTQLLRLPGCKITCEEKLLEIMEKHTVVLDTNRRMIGEYNRNLNNKTIGKGQAFMNWLFANQYNPERCNRVEITELGENEYAEFPSDDPALQNFDLSDRKFVALVLAHGQQYDGVLPIILNATDSDWVEYETALASHGITIEFLCGRDLKADQTD